MASRLFRRRTGRLTFLSTSGILSALVLMLSAASALAAYDLIPWAANTHPSDVARNRVEDVTEGSHTYTVHQAGTMDGENCRTPLSVGMDGTNNAPMEKTWESNRSLRMENVGTADVVNPWISNGRNNFRSREEIVAVATANCSTPREKALAIYWNKIPYHFHRQGHGADQRDPVRVLNVYGYHVCGSDAILMGFLWKAAGFSKVQPTHLMSHAEAQVYYDDRLNFMDADQETYVLLRDNHTVANEQDIARDHDLVKRTHTMGIFHRDDRTNDEGYASMFSYEGQPEGDRGSGAMKTTMNMTLRPNEAIVWRWGALNPIKYDGYKSLPISPYVLCNGLWEYRPNFTDDATWRKGAVAATNIVNTAGTLTAAAGQTGAIVWKITSPYVMLGGRIAPTGNGGSFSFSRDNAAWKPVSGNSLDSHFHTIRDSFNDTSFPNCYEYYLKCELSGGDKLTGLSIVTDVQMNGLIMPGMVVGDNKFVYTDETSGSRAVRITHDWVERSATNPPNAPASAIYPTNGGESKGTDIVFQWAKAIDPDGDAIVDYQFELSERSDMKFPLSPNFQKLLSKTSDKGKSQYALPFPGMLTPEVKYYWHVKAKDQNGVWSAWSDTWSFTAKGCAFPVDVTLDATAGGVGTLRWSANPVGTKPAKYRIYGSDEKGFSVSDRDYTVSIGVSKEVTNPFPSNFVCETSDTSVDVAGAGLTLPNTNKAYYRVVAVDSNDKRSWSSDYVAAPRPFVYSTPVGKSRAGAPYSYQVKTIRSLGDLSERTSGFVRSFWDIEKPTFTLVEAPDGLSIDAKTGLITGTPKAGGTVKVSVSLERSVQKVDVTALSWGQEKVLSTSTLVLGPIEQQYTLTLEQ
jgi:hypothetical protein